MKNISVVILLFISHILLAQIDTTILFDLEKIREINTSYHEGHPVVTADGNTIYYFVTNHPRNNDGGDDSQDIWYSTKNEKGVWSEPKHFENFLNKRKYNEVFSVVNDGNSLLITGAKDKDDRGMAISHLKDGEWGKPEYLTIEGYTDMNVGRFSGACMTNDMSVIVHYFSEAKDAQHSDLYVSFKTGELQYSKPQKLPFNTAKDEFGPFITFDNEKLFFSSTRDGGLGDADIYEITRLDDTWMKWSKPVNVGFPVNTSGFDAYFTMDSKGEHAYTTRSYVSRDGGSLDILGLVPKPEIKFKGVIKDIFTKELLPGHLEISVLGKGSLFFETDDQARFGTYTIREKGKYVIAVYAEDYDDYYDTLDLRRVKDNQLIEKEILLHPTKPEVYIHGIVYDESTSQKIEANLKFELAKHHDIIAKSGAKNGYYKALLHDIGLYKVTVTAPGYNSHTETFKIKDEGEEFYEIDKDFYINKGQIITLSGTVMNDKTEEPMQVDVKYIAMDGFKGKVTTEERYGTFETKLASTGKYKLIVTKEGFLNYKEEIEISETKEDVFFQKVIRLVPIEIGATVRLNEIYFDTDKSDLRKKSYPEMNLAVEFMKDNPTIVIEIQGHTDDRGSNEHNRVLSDDRANAVMYYMLDKGIDPSRMTAKGYGETAPEVPNNSDDNRQHNRRVQFVIKAK